MEGSFRQVFGPGGTVLAAGLRFAEDLPQPCRNPEVVSAKLLSHLPQHGAV